MDMRKRRPDTAFNSNGSFKKHKQELESLSTIGSKSKPCTKFFSTAGCPFGESCHFLHHVPGGYNAVAQMMNLAPVGSQSSRNMAAPPSIINGGSSAPSQVKTRLCNKFNSAEGCKFGDKCNFAHGEWELGRPAAPPSHDNPRAMGGHMVGRMGGRMDQLQPGPAASFGASATAKISIDASLAGAIIGKGGINSKQICRQTGAKLSIRDHESDPNLRNIEMEGTFEQINEASAMVRELIITVSMAGPGKPGKAGPGKAPGAMGGGPAPSGSNFKTKTAIIFPKVLVLLARDAILRTGLPSYASLECDQVFDFVYEFLFQSV